MTLLGIGGVGKTRLAAEVAHAWGEATRQRTCYVDLTKVADPGLVAELTVSELGIRSGDNSNVVQMLEEALQRQSLLLVLDNFEHVVEAADLVGDMLQWSTDLRVLVTSRARLRVAGEHVHEVHPLTLEGGHGTDGLADADRPVRPGRDRRRPPLRAGRTTSTTSPRSAVPWTGCPSRSRSPAATCARCPRRCCASG